MVPVRIVLVTFLLTLLSFACSLLLGIVGLVVQAKFRGIHPDMTYAYRHVALPVAAGVGLIALIGVTVTEVRNFRQSRVLAAIARRSR